MHDFKAYPSLSQLLKISFFLEEEFGFSYGCMVAKYCFFSTQTLFWSSFQQQPWCHQRFQEVHLEDITQYSKIIVGDIVLIEVNSLFIVKFVIFFIARVTTKNDQINDQLLCGHF